MISDGLAGRSGSANDGLGVLFRRSARLGDIAGSCCPKGTDWTDDPRFARICVVVRGNLAARERIIGPGIHCDNVLLVGAAPHPTPWRRFDEPRAPSRGFSFAVVSHGTPAALSSCGVRLIDLPRGLWQGGGMGGDNERPSWLTYPLPCMAPQDYVFYFK